MVQAKHAIAAPTSRRNFIKSGAAVIAALTLPALANAAVPFVEGEFAAKCKRFRELKAALENLYEANHIKLERLKCPELPATLLEPLELPGIGMKTPDENGWCKSELERFAKQGHWEVNVSNPKAGTVTVKSGFRPVSQKTKDRAAELLLIRVAHDTAVKRWWSKVNRIENSTRRPMKKMDDALLEAMEHRVTHVGELFQKVHLAKEADLFPDHSYPGHREDVNLECLFRDIEKLALQA